MAPTLRLTEDVLANDAETSLPARPRMIYVVHGEIVNNGTAAATTSAIKIIFKKSTDVLGEKSYPQKLGPIAPGARLSFSQALDEPPAGTTDIVPAVE